MRRLLLLPFILFLASCGFYGIRFGDGQNHNALPASGQAFINETSATDAALLGQWQLAQKQIATYGWNSHGQPAPDHPPNSAVYNIEPHGVTVISVPDIPLADLGIDTPTWANKTDPSGVILCKNGHYVHACTDLGKSIVWVAQSGVPGYLEWEFLTILVNALGYDASGM